MGKQRQVAFRQDVQFMKDHHYWHNYILNESEARKEDRERRKESSLYGHPDSTTHKAQRKPSTPRNASIVVSDQQRYAPPIDSYGSVWQPSTRFRIMRRLSGKDNDCIIVNRQTSPFAPRRTAANTSERRRLGTPDVERSPMAKKARRRKRIGPIVIDSDTGDEVEVVTKACLRRRSPVGSTETDKPRHVYQLTLPRIRS